MSDVNDAALTLRGSLAATTLAQYVRLESCERYLWYRLHAKETRELFREYRVTEQPLTPLLSQKGARHEERITEELKGDGLEVIDLSEQDVEATIEQLRRGAEGKRCSSRLSWRGTSGRSSHAGLPTS